MHKNSWGAALAVTVSIAALSLAGCESSAPKAAVSSHTSVAATAKGSSGKSGNARVLVYSVNTDGADFRAIVAGSVGDYGPAVSVYPNGKPDPSHSSQLELQLTRGSFRLNIAALDKAFVKAADGEPVYPQTCSDFASVTADTPIVSGSGTGSYRKIKGTFTMTANLNEIEASSCKAGNPASFVAQVITLAGSGTISP